MRSRLDRHEVEIKQRLDGDLIDMRYMRLRLDIHEIKIICTRDIHSIDRS